MTLLHYHGIGVATFSKISKNCLWNRSNFTLRIIHVRMTFTQIFRLSSRESHSAAFCYSHNLFSTLMIFSCLPPTHLVALSTIANYNLAAIMLSPSQAQRPRKLESINHSYCCHCCNFQMG